MEMHVSDTSLVFESLRNVIFPMKKENVEEEDPCCYVCSSLRVV